MLSLNPDYAFPMPNQGPLEMLIWHVFVGGRQAVEKTPGGLGYFVSYVEHMFRRRVP